MALRQRPIASPYVPGAEFDRRARVAATAGRCQLVQPVPTDCPAAPSLSDMRPRLLRARRGLRDLHVSDLRTTGLCLPSHQPAYAANRLARLRRKLGRILRHSRRPISRGLRCLRRLLKSDPSLQPRAMAVSVATVSRAVTRPGGATWRTPVQQDFAATRADRLWPQAGRASFFAGLSNCVRVLVSRARHRCRGKVTICD